MIQAILPIIPQIKDLLESLQTIIQSTYHRDEIQGLITYLLPEVKPTSEYIE